MFAISPGVGCEAACKAETSRLNKWASLKSPTTGWVCVLTNILLMDISEGHFCLRDIG
jgi:hypothetical protein